MPSVLVKLESDSEKSDLQLSDRTQMPATVSLKYSYKASDPENLKDNYLTCV